MLLINKVAENLPFFITENYIRIVIYFVYSPKVELWRSMSKFNSWVHENTCLMRTKEESGKQKDNWTNSWLPFLESLWQRSTPGKHSQLTCLKIWFCPHCSPPRRPSPTCGLDANPGFSGRWLPLSDDGIRERKLVTYLTSHYSTILVAANG